MKDMTRGPGRYPALPGVFDTTRDDCFDQFDAKMVMAARSSPDEDVGDCR